MAEIVNSLFGLDRLGIEQQIRQEQDAVARSLAQGGVMPSRNYAGALIGQRLGSALAKGLFGVEDPRLAKASKLEAAMQQVNSSLTEEDRANPANVYFKLSQTLAQDPDLQNEAMMAQQKAQELGVQFETRQADIASKRATAMKAEQDALLKQQDYLREEQGRAALLKAAETKGSPLTTEETIQVLSAYLPPEKLVPLLQTSQDKAAYRDVMKAQMQQAHEDRLARIDMIADQKERDRQAQLERLAYQRETQALIKSIGAANKPLSGREARYADNVAIGANEAIGGINTIVNLPKNVTGGFWGAGLPKMQAGTGLFEAPIGALKNELTPEVVQRYNAEISNIGKNFSVMRNGGLASTNDDVNKFEQQYRINQGDKPLTALTKLAQMRQFFERVAEIKIKSKATPPEQVENWNLWLQQVQESIPLTVNDINAIANSKNKQQTFKEALTSLKVSKNKTIPQGAIDKLRADPTLAKDFDAKYGAGASKNILGE